VISNLHFYKMSKGGVLNFSEAFHLVFMLDLKVIFLRYDVVITQWKNLDKEPIKIKKKALETQR